MSPSGCARCSWASVKRRPAPGTSTSSVPSRRHDEEEPDGGSALVVLAGRVQVARPELERDGELQRFGDDRAGVAQRPQTARPPPAGRRAPRGSRARRASRAGRASTARHAQPTRARRRSAGARSRSRRPAAARSGAPASPSRIASRGGLRLVDVGLVEATRCPSAPRRAPPPTPSGRTRRRARTGRRATAPKHRLAVGQEVAESAASDSSSLGAQDERQAVGAVRRWQARAAARAPAGCRRPTCRSTRRRAARPTGRTTRALASRRCVSLSRPSR